MGKKNKGNKKAPAFSAQPEESKGEAQFNLLAPFGPSIGMVQLPPAFTNKMIELSDSILLDKDRVDWGQNLVGQINEEPWISNKQLEEAGLLETFNSCLNQYVISMLHRQGLRMEEHLGKVGVHLDHMWIVSQYENEYNPVHFHTYCDISAVMYLKIPDFRNRMLDGDLPKYKNSKDGQIELIYGVSDANGCERGSLSVAPEPGMLLIFPSNLLHTVYPFKGDGERRSIAFNSHWNAVKKDGRLLDKSMRPPSDQSNKDYLKSFKSKGEVSRYAIEDNQ